MSAGACIPASIHLCTLLVLVEEKSTTSLTYDSNKRAVLPLSPDARVLVPRVLQDLCPAEEYVVLVELHVEVLPRV
jgi:hypothetical protein